MFTKKYQTAISIIFITAAVLVAGCKQESPDHQERNRLAQEARTAAPAATGRMAEEADIDQSVTGGTADGRRANQPGAPGQQDEGGFFTAVRMKSMLVRPMEKAAERLLEYHVSLEYQCADFQKARQELLAIVSQYGFIRSGRTDIGGTSSLNLGIAVQAKDLYRFLLDMEHRQALLRADQRQRSHGADGALAAPGAPRGYPASAENARARGHLGRGEELADDRRVYRAQRGQPGPGRAPQVAGDGPRELGERFGQPRAARRSARPSLQEGPVRTA